MQLVSCMSLGCEEQTEEGGSTGVGPSMPSLSRATQTLHPPGDVVHQQGSSCPSVITSCHRPVGARGTQSPQGWDLPRDCPPLWREASGLSPPPLLLACPLKPDLGLPETQSISLMVYLNYCYDLDLFF